MLTLGVRVCSFESGLPELFIRRASALASVNFFNITIDMNMKRYYESMLLLYVLVIIIITKSKSYSTILLNIL